MHHQFFQASPMKLLPLIGSLLISAAPVQAIETFEELDKACKASEETYNTCTKAAVFVGTAAWVNSLCELEAKGRLISLPFASNSQSEFTHAAVPTNTAAFVQVLYVSSEALQALSNSSNVSIA